MPSSCSCCGQVSEVLAPLPGVLGQLTPVFRWSFPFAPNDHRLPSANPAGWFSLRRTLRLCTFTVLRWFTCVSDNKPLCL
jgi:hypothetical protein